MSRHEIIEKTFAQVAAGSSSEQSGSWSYSSLSPTFQQQQALIREFRPLPPPLLPPPPQPDYPQFYNANSPQVMNQPQAGVNNSSGNQLLPHREYQTDAYWNQHFTEPPYRLSDYSILALGKLWLKTILTPASNISQGDCISPPLFVQLTALLATQVRDPINPARCLLEDCFIQPNGFGCENVFHSIEHDVSPYANVVAAISSPRYINSVLVALAQFPSPQQQQVMNFLEAFLDMSPLQQIIFITYRAFQTLCAIGKHRPEYVEIFLQDGSSRFANVSIDTLYDGLGPFPGLPYANQYLLSRVHTVLVPGSRLLMNLLAPFLRLYITTHDTLVKRVLNDFSIVSSTRLHGLFNVEVYRKACQRSQWRFPFSHLITASPRLEEMFYNGRFKREYDHLAEMKRIYFARDQLPIPQSDWHWARNFSADYLRNYCATSNMFTTCLWTSLAFDYRGPGTSDVWRKRLFQRGKGLRNAAFQFIAQRRLQLKPDQSVSY